MNKIFITLILAIYCLIPNFLFSQCYTVLSVKGEIISEKTGQPIKELDEICATDKLKFSSKDSKAAVLSPDQGRFVVKFAGKKTENGLIAFVSSALFAGKERLSTKIMEFDEEEMNLKLFKEEFGNEYFILNESRIYADTSFYKLGEINYFSLNYFYNGIDIECKLAFNKNCIVINKDVLNKANPEKIEIVNLHYNDGINKSSKKLASFKLNFLDGQNIKTELSNYISLMKNSGKDDYYIIQQAQYYIGDLYGNINYYDLATYIESNFGIKGF
jgi:hypothetical protein